MLCESCGFAAAIETVPDRRHRVPSTFRLCRDCAAEARGVLMPPRTENHDARLAMLRALAAHNGPMTREMLLVAIAAEEDEKRMLHGVISGLIRATYVTAAGANLHLTPKGRRQVEPPETPQAGTVIPGALESEERAAMAGLREALERVGHHALVGRVDLMTAAREAVETIHNLRRIERLYNDDREAKERAEAESTALRARLDISTAEVARLQADLEKVNDETLEMYEKLEDEHRAEKAAHARKTDELIAAEAEITRLRADLDRECQHSAWAVGKIDSDRAAVVRLAGCPLDSDEATTVLLEQVAERLKEAEQALADPDGPYWTRQGDRHTLSILRPVEIAVLLVDPASVGWEAGRHNGRVVGSGPEALDLAQRLAELAAGVRS